jgi:excisionase family DNA binding protein
MPTHETNAATALRIEGNPPRIAVSEIKSVFNMWDLAEMFECNRETVKRMARRGEIPAFKFGKQWYVRKEDLEGFLADRVQLTGHLRRIQEV